MAADQSTSAKLRMQLEPTDPSATADEAQFCRYLRVELQRMLQGKRMPPFRCPPCHNQKGAKVSGMCPV